MKNASKLGTKLSDYNLIDWGYDEMLADLQRGKHFAYSRWGDGEWQCLLGSSRRWNCDGHTYFEGLANRLREVILSNPPYYKGLQPDPGLNILGERIYNFTKGKKIKWVNSNILHQASLNGSWCKGLTNLAKEYPDMEFVNGRSLEQYFEVVRRRKNILVANRWLHLFDRFEHRHVMVREKDAYLSYDEILANTIVMCKQVGKNAVVHIAASLMTGVLIDDLYKRFEDDFTFVDVGSALDPYVKGDNGKRRNIRSYHKKLIIQ